jgi:hypothetical protein
MPIKLHTQADADMHLKDMLYDETSVDGTQVTATYNEPVNFNFSHLLSKVHFTVTSAAEGGYYHTVTGISVSNFETGTYTISKDKDGNDTSSWTGTTAKQVEFAAIENVTAKDAEGKVVKKSNADMLLVPNAATFNVTFTVDLYKGTTKLGTETITKTVETDLVKGNAYNFTIACSVGNPIKFSVENDPSWPTQPENVTIQ